MYDAGYGEPWRTLKLCDTPPGLSANFRATINGLSADRRLCFLGLVPLHAPAGCEGVSATRREGDTLRGEPFDGEDVPVALSLVLAPPHDVRGDCACGDERLLRPMAVV